MKGGRIFGVWVCAVWLSVQSVGAAEEAKLICEAPDYGFGTQVNTEVVRHTFLLRNTGSVTAVISRVHSTCGCTTANPTRMQIPPGESEPVSAQFNLHGRTGPQNRPLYVNYNSLSNVPLRLSLSGTAAAEVSVEPGSFYLGLRAGESAVQQTVRVRSFYSNEIFRVTNAISSAVRFTATVEERIPGQEYAVQVTDTQPELTGETNAVITVTGSAAVKGPLRIALRKFPTRPGLSGVPRR
jgi:hypothetical protein